MDRGDALLNGLRNQMERWQDPIKRATCAATVSFISRQNGEFTVRVEWRQKDCEAKTFDYEVTRKGVFGASYGHSPLTWRVEKRACDYARDVMRQVLAARGV